MKLSKTKSYLATFLLSTFLMSFNLVEAVQPKIKLSDIVTPQPTEENQLATKRATTRLTQSHYRKFQLNDAFSEKIFERYLKSLDFSRNTFLQSDIDEMRAKYADKFDDALNEGDLSIAFAMYDLMMKRRYDRYKYALSLLDKEPDLSGQDQIEIDREKILVAKRQRRIR